MSGQRVRGKVACTCYKCKGVQPPVQPRTVAIHRRKQHELLDGILAASDLSLAPAALADAAAAAYFPPALDAGSDDYVDGNPISQLLNWDAKLTVHATHRHRHIQTAPRICRV